VLLNSASGTETLTTLQYLRSAKLLQITGGGYANENPDFLEIAEEAGAGGAMLVMRPDF
jgi:hypothetical protein